MKMLLAWLINAACLIGTAYVIPGIQLSGRLPALIAAVALGAVNLVLKPLVSLLTLPVTILTLGLFSLVINALMFGLAAWLVPGFGVDGFWAAFWGALLFSLLSAAVSALLLCSDD